MCVTFSRDGRRIASGSKDKSIRVYRETSSGQWSVTLLLSSSRSLSFTDAAVTGVRMSAANKIVLDQHGAVIASDGSASNIGFGALVVPDAQATQSNISGGGFNSGSTHQRVSDAPNISSITSAASASGDARVAKPGSQDGVQSLGVGESESRSIDTLPDLERSHGIEDIHERLNAVQSGLTAVHSQMQAVQEQQASIVGAIGAQDALLARIVSLLSPST